MLLSDVIVTRNRVLSLKLLGIATLVTTLLPVAYHKARFIAALNNYGYNIALGSLVLLYVFIHRYMVDIVTQNKKCSADQD